MAVTPNQATANQKPASRRMFKALLGPVKSKKFWAIFATLSSMTAGVAAFITNFETLASRGIDYLRTRQYLHALQNPYPSLLKEQDIASWDNGTLELAIYQIQGYLGDEKLSYFGKRG
jgi:hypothetical protein